MAVDEATARRKAPRNVAATRARVAGTAAKATAAGVAVVALALGLWKVRSIIIILSLLALTFAVVAVQFQSYVINPHLMGHSVGLSPMVTLVSVSVFGLVFGGLAVVLAIPVT